MRTRPTLIALVALATLAPAAPALGHQRELGDWGAPANLEAIEGTSTEVNTAFTDGCPIQSPDGTSLYLASNRPGGLGGLDIWVARRTNAQAPFGEPENLGAPVNGPQDDFCPTPTSGRLFFFISTRDGGCGEHPTGDLYLSWRGRHGFTEPENLGCAVNSPAAEFSPSWVREGRHEALYFSSNRPDGFAPEAPADADIYRTVLGAHGDFRAPDLVDGLNTPFDDARPNVRHDGLEIVFDSNRPGTLGGPDVYAASRTRVRADWSEPVNLGPTINGPAAETRASLSRRGATLLFGSNRPGSEPGPDGTTPSTDIYVATR